MAGAAVDTPSGSTTPAPPTDLRPSVPILSFIDGEAAFRSAWANDAPGIMREVSALSQAVTNMHEEIMRLRQVANTTNSHIDTLQTRLSNTLMESNDKDETISHMAGQLEAYKVIAATGGSHHQRSAEHPKPDPFNGNNPNELPEFLQKLELKLHMNRDWWTDETERMGFVISCLSGDAHAQVSHNISHGIVKFTNVEAIIATLKTVYGDIDSAATAQKEIYDMKQGHKSLASFLPNWIAVAKLTEFEDKSLISHLKRALHPDIIWRLVVLKVTPATLREFIELVRQCDSECRQLNADYYKKKPSNNNKAPTSTAPAISRSQTPLATNEGDAMDLSAASWGPKDVASGRKPRTMDEREARRAYCTAHGLCNWCNSTDHTAHICPTAPWNSKEGKV
ncbi:retrotransposon nucleocapsid protein [Cordyceps fumosorosea ARSEF 2679]|uniref:Retrotransposon nucleocapsid protein n=1 Tax=Cordyceps fumosorosea (strain ARSEF 2679) TaxID=1081104 RepID=A0A166WMA9_CORFA|nr:retrotransposon nucleocapsid protein [Cordyceps fumosorosea ARSEF 2679]OAA34886.1 retrotransposon nucleocapsid protein [Cordyceps fumosorosea ARSEF 2679]